jgi:hypothetical protein
MTFETYWARYVSAHRHPIVRRVHVAATGAALACAALGLVTRQRWLLLCAPGVAYVPARLSHYFFEQEPQTVTEAPLYEALANLLLFLKALNGTLETDLGEEPAPAAASEPFQGDSVSPAPNMVTDRTLH